MMTTGRVNVRSNTKLSVSMYTPRTLTQVLKSAWRRPKPQLVRVPDTAVKFFEQKPPVWARWALVLVSVDVMVAYALHFFYETS